MKATSVITKTAIQEPLESQTAATSECLKPALPDIRIGLAMLLVVTIGTSVIRTELGSSLLTAFSLGVGVVLGRWRSMARLAISYLILRGLQWICILGSSLPVLPWLGIITTIILHAYPSYVLLWLIFIQVPMGQMMASLARLRVPGTALVVLLVVYRYVPTLLGEIRTIWSVSRLRHTQPAWKRWLINPIRQLEYLFVPILMRSGRIADELSAVALCKGLDADQHRTEMIKPEIGPANLVLLVTTITIVMAVRIWVG